MSLHEMKLPDVGEGVAEAEIVAWLVQVGDEVTPDSVIAEVLTDKATVEISPPVTGTVVALHGEPGDVLAVGSSLVGIEVGDDNQAPPVEPEPPANEPVETEPSNSDSKGAEAEKRPERQPTARALASPAVRQRADTLGIELAEVSGSGPDGRVVHADLDDVLMRAPTGGSSRRETVEPKVTAVRGIRRKIADQLSATWSAIPHITYIDGVDVTELEKLRAELNSSGDHMRLTMLPFVVRATVIACREQREMNAHYDHESGNLTVFGDVHVGIATQTDRGLLVPVLRDADNLSLRDSATEIARLTEAARKGEATREELSGSTITISSLGAIGGLASTPILNAPEVAIIGVNKMETRPVWSDGAFHPRQMINLSSSFDHRMVDGWDAARFVQRVKSLIETPALLFVD